ncbi:MAG: protein phosphatase CheZ [Methylohalobius sp.]|nr:protein phosphatase CheZ [Methylohalobius sp.]
METRSLEQRLEQARALVAALERGDVATADRVVDEIGRLREKQLFQELCQLTRQLHDALASFLADAQLAELAANDIPDARERLRYVITLTEQAATTTLNALDEMLPLVEGLEAKIQSLAGRWGKFLQREMSYREFRTLSGDLATFLQDASPKMETLRARLHEVLMAQSFQDLSGQIIRRVIGLVQQVETSLVELIRFSGQKGELRHPNPTSGDLAGRGPSVPGLDKGQIANQDEVDDLLSSLGF